MFKKKAETKTKREITAKPISRKDFPEFCIKNARVVSESKVLFTLELMEGLSIHDMQLIQKKESDEYFIAPPQISYKNKAGFYQNKNFAFVYMEEDFSKTIIDIIRAEFEDEHE